MKYCKPEIVSVVNANDAVQGVPKGTMGHDMFSPTKQTVAAYEADE
jgi:hypothetical protein